MYTKEQLINGMIKYYTKVNENPDGFENDFSDVEKSAVETIEYLISLIDEK